MMFQKKWAKHIFGWSRSHRYRFSFEKWHHDNAMKVQYTIENLSKIWCSMNCLFSFFLSCFIKKRCLPPYTWLWRWGPREMFIFRNVHFIFHTVAYSVFWCLYTFMTLFRHLKCVWCGFLFYLKWNQCKRWTTLRMVGRELTVVCTNTRKTKRKNRNLWHAKL